MTSSIRRQGIDPHGQQLHARLAAAVSLTREALTPPADRAADVLEQRARRLAQPLSAPQPASAMLDLLVFRLAGERYAIETAYVQEVSRVAGLTPVPGVPEIVAGVVNLRGQIIVVFDIRIVLGLKPWEAAPSSRVLVCGSAEPDLGLLVDWASEVVRLPDDAVRIDPGSDDDVAADFVRGMTNDAMVVLDGAALLADPRLFVEMPRGQ